MNLTYSGAHQRITRLRGKASEHECSCGHQAQQWAYDYRNPCPNELVDPRGYKYSGDVDRYLPMCATCHTKFDKARITHCPANHEYTPENTIVEGNKRKCRECNNERGRRRPPLTPEQQIRANERLRAWRERQKNLETPA